jgi:hypothetical protein
MTVPKDNNGPIADYTSDALSGIHDRIWLCLHIGQSLATLIYPPNWDF